MTARLNDCYLAATVDLAGERELAGRQVVQQALVAEEHEEPADSDSPRLRLTI